MKSFVENEWKNYVERMSRSAKFYAADDEKLASTFQKQIDEFQSNSEVSDWTSLLAAIKTGQGLVMEWRDKSPQELEEVS